MSRQPDPGEHRLERIGSREDVAKYSELKLNSDGTAVGSLGFRPNCYRLISEHGFSYYWKLDNENKAIKELGSKRPYWAPKMHSIELSCDSAVNGASVLGYGGILLMCEGDENADPKKCIGIFGAGGAGIGGFGLLLSKSAKKLEDQGGHAKFGDFSVNGKVIWKGKSRYDFCRDGTFRQVNYKFHFGRPDSAGLEPLQQSPETEISGRWKQDAREIHLKRRRMRNSNTGVVSDISENITEDWENDVLSDTLQVENFDAEDCNSI